MYTATSTQSSQTRDTRAPAAAIERISQALTLLSSPGQVIELRIPGINGKRTDSGYFTDFEKLARCAVSYYGRAEGIYITLNPVNPALLARSSNRITEYARNTTADKDVTRRRWIFVDFDPVRPAGISSSDTEHDAAIARAIASRDWLQMQGIACIVADSGNGAHGLIPIDLPNDSESLALVKNVLQVISDRFSNEAVEVDTSTTNASRIIKLYGTMASKGDNIPERPHRWAQILHIPSELEPVDQTILEALVPPATTHAPQKENIAKPVAQLSTNRSGDGIRDFAFDRTTIEAIKASFDMVAYAETVLGIASVKEGNQFRMPGNQGFLIHPEKGCWYHHGGHVGGDAIDMVGYLRFGSRWSRQDAGLFREAIAESARFAGVALPTKTPHQSEPVSAPTPNSPPPPDSLTRRKVDLMDIAQAWKQRYADELAWDVDRLCWRRWNGTHWQEEREAENLDLLAVDVMRSLEIPVNSTQKIDALIRLAKALCKRQFQYSSRLVNFKNGTLDLDTMTGHTHNPYDHLTECLPFNYDSKSSSPTTQNFLNQAIPDPEGRKAFMTHVGLALIGDRSLHKALVLLGPPRSGKTTLLKLAQMTLGTPPGRFPSAILFSAQGRGANSRATWRDHSPRLVCLDEFPEEAVRDEGEDLFKSMTAHGGVAMWQTYQREQSDNTWTPKLLFATNNRMRYRDSSGALTRRLLIITCPNGLPDSKLDGALLDKLSAELGAFAAQCISLGLEAQRAHAYPESHAMRALLSDIERNGDAVKLWASEQCIIDKTAFTSTQALYSHFALWCEENGLHAVSRPKLRDMLCGNHVGVIPNKQRIKDPVSGVSKPIWGLVGIRLRTDGDDE